MDKKPVRTRKYGLPGTRQLLSRFAAIAISACVVGAGTHANATELSKGENVNLGSGFTVPIVGNDGQLPNVVGYMAPGPTGNSVYFFRNASIGLALRGYNGSDNSFTSISHVGSDASFQAGNALQSVTHYFGGSPNLPANAANYGSVVASDIYEGVSAVFEVSGRQLIANYEVAAGSSAEAIKLQFDYATGIAFNEGTNDIEVTLSPNRVLHLHAARVSVDGGEATFVPFALDANDNPTLDLAAIVSSTATVNITVKVTFGPYYHDYDAVRDNNQELVAVSTGFNTASIGGNASNADIMITRLTGDASQVVSTTILAGNGDDVAYGVAVSNVGKYADQIYVSGLTESTDLPIEGQPMGGGDACVVRFNADGSAVLGGVRIGALGRDVAHDIAIATTGTVVVVGATDGGIEDVKAAELDFTTVFPHVTTANSTTAQTYYLSVLDAEATGVRNVVSFGGPRIGIKVLTGFDLQNHVLIGVEWEAKATADCNYMSEMDYWFNTPCRSTVGAQAPEWGWHALCWKDLRSTGNVLTLPHPTSPGDEPPSYGLTNTDHTKLNNLEATKFTGGDPGGVWQLNHYNNYSTAPGNMLLELALGAAYYHECCGSPVYANHWVGVDYPFLIRRVYMHVEDSGGNPVSLTSLCASQYSSSGNGDMFDLNCMSSYFGQLEFCSFDVVFWSPEIVPDADYTLRNFGPGTLTSRISGTGLYIADPPEDQGAMSDNIQEIAHQLQRTVVGATDVHIVKYSSGQAVEDKIESGIIRMAAFPAPDHAAALPTSIENNSDRLSASSPFGTLESHPNPASGEVSISYEVSDVTTMRLELYDAMGHKIDVVDSGQRYPRRYTVSYDTGKLSAGTYYLRLSSDAGVLTMPLTVIR